MGKLSSIKNGLPKRMNTLRYLFKPTKINKVVDYNSPVIMDTSIGSDNAGDFIIMNYANAQLSSIWHDYSFPRVATHGSKATEDRSISGKGKILCGTNALTLSVNRSIPVSLPADTTIYEKSIVLLAVGLRGLDHNDNFTDETAHLLRYLLADDKMHSVRDSHTKECLNRIGITNVLNTSCVTLWNLNEEFCTTIPKNKHTDVLTTITDYCFSPEKDSYMIRELKRQYRNVYLWIQGKHDLELFASLNIEGIKIIRHGFDGLNDFVKNHTDFDYFGTRLHCGIFCLNHGIRSMIVSVDNRAEDIEHDTNLPVVKREALADHMEKLVEYDRATEIQIPVKEIQAWKSQFSENRSE